ncbi:MAG TPA: hypothetical protein VGL94_13005 [Ktedonobacteraceae bacterium]|jgi:hypothetical protein
MNREDGRCSFCGQSLDPSSSTCPSCRRDIFQPQIDELVSYKIQPRPLSIALTPRNLAIGGAALLLIVAMPLIAFLSLSRSGSTRPIGKTVITHNQSPPSISTSKTVLCQADWSRGMNGWTGSSEWKVLNGKLLSDGMNIGLGISVAPTGSDVITSPCQPSTTNYAVEAKMQILDSPNRCYLAIRGRVEPAGSGYGGYFVGFDSYFGDAAIIPFSPSEGFTPSKSRIYNPGLNEHTYRVEFRDNQITLKIDNHVVLQAIDNRFLSTGEVGLENGGCQISISSFQVIAL